MRKCEICGAAFHPYRGQKYCGADCARRAENLRRRRPWKPRARGVGVFDCPGESKTRWGECWSGMLSRCYSPATQKKHPTYSRCEVCPEWHIASNFKPWYLERYFEGCELDKDLLGDGTLYSPETCCLIPRWLNLLMTDHRAKRGKWPQGVYTGRGRFCACINEHGKNRNLGRFDTVEAAMEAYFTAKEAYVLSLPIPDHLLPGVLRVLERQKSRAVCQCLRLVQ